MQNFDFSKLVYKRPRISKGKRYIRELLGLDCEAYTDGKPFIFCISDGTSFTLKDIPEIFFRREYRGKHFVTWRLKYDSGAVLYNLPLERKNELRTDTVTVYKGYKYTYIPHKLLRISYGKNAVNIWDIAQYFDTSLDKAARKYIGKGKISCDVELFRPAYVTEHLQDITKYCINDAVITQELGQYLLDTLNDLGLRPANLYSSGSIGFTYIKNHAKIIDVWDFWLYHKRLLHYACNSYAGGKFEVTARGSFTGYEYDITSAYPYEIYNLYDISNTVVLHDKKYCPEAKYGYLKVYIDTDDVINHSVPYFKSIPNYYPIGTFGAYITKDEYDYFISINVDVKILDAYWLIINKVSYPYRTVVKELCDIKEKSKDTDPRIYLMTKKMLNSFYGKMVQVIEKPDGKLEAATSWNIIYGSVITANVRLRLSKLQQQLGKDCYAVHTDSIITRKLIPPELIGNELGKFNLCKQGIGIIVSCGMYQIGDKSAFRGFIMPDNFSWTSMLSRIGDRKKISLSQRTLISWFDAAFRNRPELTNLIVNDSKVLHLNRDSKRVWSNDVTGSSLLSGLQYSYPIVKVDSLKDTERILSHVS